MARALPQLDRYRQSTLRAFERCGRRTRFELQNGGVSTGWVETSAELGSAFHAVAAEMLRTLYRQGEIQMPTQEAVEIMREVLAASDFNLPAEDRDTLRYLVLGFCEYKWQPNRIMALEERLIADIVCPDGEVRTVTGQPDLLIADPPHGITVCDWKTGLAKPREPRQKPEGDVIEGKQFLSDRGHFQLDCYGLLAMRTYPSAEYVTLRELHMRSGTVREATLQRAELEHIEWEIGNQMMLLDRAIKEGPKSELWKPRPGRHCNRCPVARSCSIPVEQRGDGALNSAERMDKAARAFIQLDAKRSQLRDQLKAAHEETGHYAEVGDGTVIGWNPPVGKGRKFGPFVPTGQEETAA